MINEFDPDVSSINSLIRSEIPKTIDQITLSSASSRCDDLGMVACEYGWMSGDNHNVYC